MNFLSRIVDVTADVTNSLGGLVTSTANVFDKGADIYLGVAQRVEAIKAIGEETESEPRTTTAVISEGGSLLDASTGGIDNRLLIGGAAILAYAILN